MVLPYSHTQQELYDIFVGKHCVVLDHRNSYHSNADMSCAHGVRSEKPPDENLFYYERADGLKNLWYISNNSLRYIKPGTSVLPVDIVRVGYRRTWHAVILVKEALYCLDINLLVFAEKFND